MWDEHTAHSEGWDMCGMNILHIRSAGICVGSTYCTFGGLGYVWDEHTGLGYVLDQHTAHSEGWDM